MIFRRIKAHVEKENWFAVFIDFCIVVVGVFIGIQVANWNQARAERDLAADLVSRMISEAMATRGELKQYTLVHQVISDDAARLAVSLKDKDACLANVSALKTLIVGISDFPPIRFSLSNAEQAMDTGSLALIPSIKVRNSIQVIVDEMAFIDRQWQRYVQVKQYAGQEAQKSAGVALTGRGEVDVLELGAYDPGNFELLTPERICGNTEIIALVSDAVVTQKIYVDYLKQVEGALEIYLATLNAEAG